MESFNERLAWVIGKIESDPRVGCGIGAIDLAKKLCIDYKTLVKYKKGEAVSLKGSSLGVLVSEYRVNPIWLASGEGEPYIEDTQNPPVATHEPSRPPPATPAAEPSEHYRPPPGHIEDSATIAQDMALTARILSSGTHYATALHLNIRSFAAGLDDLGKTEEMATVKEKLVDLERKMGDLQQENEECRRQLKELKSNQSPGGLADGVTDTSRQTG